MEIRPRIPEDDAALPDGARAFACPGCGFRHVALPAPSERVNKDQTLQFDFECLNPECDKGKGETPYKTALGIG